MLARSLSLTRPVLARVGTASGSSSNAGVMKRFLGGHGHGPAPPTFVRLPPPNKPVHEETELIWNDGVAPEVTVDFDAPEVSKLRGLASWLGGLGFFASLMLFMKYVWDPPSFRPAVKRSVDVGDALGGYPNPRKAATEVKKA